MIQVRMVVEPKVEIGPIPEDWWAWTEIREHNPNGIRLGDWDHTTYAGRYNVYCGKVDFFRVRLVPPKRGRLPWT